VCLQPRQHKFDLKPPRGYGLGTIFKKPRPNVSNPSEQDLEGGQQDTLSVSPPPSPLDRENGHGDIKRKSSRENLQLSLLKAAGILPAVHLCLLLNRLYALRSLNLLPVHRTFLLWLQDV